MKNYLIYLLLFTLGTGLCAQPMSLEDFNQRFEKELDKISQTRQQQRQTLNVKYLGALLRMETQAKNKGDLDLVQAVRSEIKRIEKNEPLGEIEQTLPPKLKEMQQVMENLQNQYKQEDADAVVNLVDSLKEYSSARSIEATRQNDIPKALAWREWEESLDDNAHVKEAYSIKNRSINQESGAKDSKQDFHEALQGRPATIIQEATTEYAEVPKVYAYGSEPKGKEKRIRSTTPSMQGAGHTQLTGTLMLIEEKDINKSGYSGNYKEKSLVYVPRLSISPIIGKNLDRCLVVFDLYKRGTGSKRSIIRTDKILIPALSASDRVVVDAGKYEYETEEYDSSWSTYDYKYSSEDEFYGFIVTLFNKEGELIFQRASERILNDYARESPPK
ncbi:hypothetical protein P0Y35_18245 [Kiritimatiellaeota bacterium B1221]|nr:hypothetical protein [Kiritimatiellaeota bacterium B1221]